MTDGVENGWAVALRVEVRKMRAQARVRVALAVAVLGPLLFAAALAVQDGVPADTLFGRWVHESGYAVSLVVLSFAVQWLIPVLIGVVAGDMFSGEDTLGTWPLLLTRGLSRGQLVTGKALAAAAYGVLVVGALALSSLLGGLAVSGAHPLVSLSGDLLPAGQAFGDVVASWASVIPATLAFVALALVASALTRSSYVGIGVPVVAALLLWLLVTLSALDPVRYLLPTAAFEAWHGFVRHGAYYRPLVLGLAVSLVWGVVGLLTARRLVLRRDVGS